MKRITLDQVRPPFAEWHSLDDEHPSGYPHATDEAGTSVCLYGSATSLDWRYCVGPTSTPPPEATHWDTIKGPRERIDVNRATADLLHSASKSAATGEVVIPAKLAAALAEFIFRGGEA